jgi:hypothetical protein
MIKYGMFYNAIIEIYNHHVTCDAVGNALTAYSGERVLFSGSQRLEALVVAIIEQDLRAPGQLADWIYNQDFGNKNGVEIRQLWDQMTCHLNPEPHDRLSTQTQQNSSEVDDQQDKPTP